MIICGNYSSQYLLDLHYAAEALGATVLPCNSVDAAIDVIGIFNATSLIISAKNLKTMIERNVDHLPPKNHCFNLITSKIQHLMKSNIISIIH